MIEMIEKKIRIDVFQWLEMINVHVLYSMVFSTDPRRPWLRLRLLSMLRLAPLHTIRILSSLTRIKFYLMCKFKQSSCRIIVKIPKKYNNNKNGKL